MKRFLLSPRRFSFIMVGLCAGLGLCFSQTAFERTYGSTGNDEAYSVQQTTDGGYIVVGSADLSGTGNLDVYLIKTNSSGDTHSLRSAIFLGVIAAAHQTIVWWSVLEQAPLPLKVAVGRPNGIAFEVAKCC